MNPSTNLISADGHQSPPNFQLAGSQHERSPCAQTSPNVERTETRSPVKKKSKPKNVKKLIFPDIESSILNEVLDRITDKIQSSKSLKIRLLEDERLNGLNKKTKEFYDH